MVAKNKTLQWDCKYLTKDPGIYVTQQYSKIYIIFISGFYGGRGGGSPKWKHDKYEEVVQMEEPSSTTDI